MVTEQFEIHEAQSPQPKYERLEGFLLAELTAGRLGPGDALPPESNLAGRFQIARHTVRKALSGLEQRGLIRRQQGKGTFVNDDVRARLRRGVDIFALVTPETRTGYYPSLLHGFETTCKTVENQAIICTTENDIDKQASTILQLMDKKVAGVAIVPATDPPTPTYQIRQLQERGIPVVFCHRRVEGVRAPLLALPFREVGQMAGEAFLRHGHRRVVMISSIPRHRFEGGFRESMESGDGELHVWESPVKSTRMADQEEATFETLKRICGNGDGPTAIFSTFDPQAEMIYLLLGRLGLRVPEDISLLGFGGTWRHSPMQHTLTSVAIDEAKLGSLAVKLLNEMRNGKRPLDDNEEIVLPLSLTDGSTLGPAPDSTGSKSAVCSTRKNLESERRSL